MAKANIIRPDGTKIDIEGSADEIRNVLSALDSGERHEKRELRTKRPTARPTKGGNAAQSGERIEEVDHATIVQLIKTCEEADAIETNILDENSQRNRVLLPLYISEKYVDAKVGLTSGDIAKILAELNVPISVPHVSTQLSKRSSRFVQGDKVRKKGVPVRYKIIRRGITYMDKVIEGGNGSDEE